MKNHSIFTSRRGSAILTSVLVTVCLAIVVYSVIDLGLNERRSNRREVLAVQARYAAESVVENAVAQIVRQLKATSYVDSDRFNTSTYPNRLTAISTSAFTSTDIETSTLELKIGDMTDYETITIPVASPDVLSGPIVTRRLTVYGKATAKDDAGNEYTAHCSETLQIRGQSPASCLGFYNVDLELAPGPTMTAAGPLFSNKNIYFAASNSLSVKGTVTTPGDLVWGRIVEDSLSAWTVSGAAQKGTVKLTSAYTEGSSDSDLGTYTLANFYSSGVYSDSLKSSTTTNWTDSKWKDYEAQTYDGMVQTSVDDVEERKFSGITDLDDAHVVIESPLANSATGYDQEVELQKFSNKAGIIIVPPTVTTTTGTTTSKTTTTVKKTKNGTTTTSSSSSSITSSSSATVTGSTTVWAYVPEGSQSGTYTGPYTRTNDDGTLGTYYLMNITSTITNLDDIISVTTGSSTTSTSTTDAGFYDEREGEWMTVYNIDVSALKTAVESAASGTPLHDYWNGILYIDDSAGYATTTTASTPNSTSSSTTTSTGSGSSKTTTVTTTTVDTTGSTTVDTGNTAIRLQNGDLGNLPEMTTATQNQAFTIATNDPVYVEGNYNANGTVDTATTENIRLQDTNEIMACIAADAVTFLSESWSDASSSKGKAYRTASQTEVSAVIMTGLVTTTVGTQYSGGMHNFPRFLENWNNTTVFGYRGALLAFFESTRATGKWSNSYYTPPLRIWGWNKGLEDGETVAGLGTTPLFKRTSFRELTAAEYTAATSDL